MEECDKTSQRASKALRFGLDEIQPGQELTNADRIVYEYNDLIAIVEMLCESEAINRYRVGDREAIDAKKAKINKYLLYSASLGILKP